MSKLLKSILVASLVACMTVCLGLFAAACNNTPEDTDKYFTVTVVLPDGNKNARKRRGSRDLHYERFHSYLP